MSLVNQSKNIDGGKWSINHAKMVAFMVAFYGTCQSSKFGGIYGRILWDLSIKQIWWHLWQHFIGHVNHI